MQSLIQILKLNEPRAWNMNGRSGMSHSAECVLLSEDGEYQHVGVLKLRGEDIIKAAKPGFFSASFALRSNPSSREIEAYVTELRPVQKAGAGFVPVDAPTASAKAPVVPVAKA